MASGQERALLQPGELKYLKNSKSNRVEIGEPQYLENLKLGRLQEEVAKKEGFGEVSVVLLDSGVAPHVDLKVNKEESKGFPSSLSPLQDPITNGYPYGHGTMLARVVSWIDPKADIVSFRVFRPISTKTGTTLAAPLPQEFVDALRSLRSLRSPKLVVNMSFSYPAESWGDSLEVLKREMESLQERVLFVIAAENQGKEESYYPCALNLPNSICVTALDKSSRLWSLSNFGSWVDIATWGEEITSTSSTGGYATASGTSFSAPMVSGVASLLWKIAPEISPSDLKKVIQSGGELNMNLIGQIARPIQASGSKSLTALRRLLSGGEEPESLELEVAAPSWSSSKADLPRGGVISLWGHGFSETHEVASDYPLPQRLGRTRVLLNGIPIPLFYAGPSQANIQLPMDFFRLWSGKNHLAVVREDENGDSEAWGVLPFRPSELNPGMLLSETGCLVFEDGKIFGIGFGVATPQPSLGLPAKAEAMSKADFMINGNSRKARVSTKIPGVYEIEIGETETITLEIGEEKQEFKLCQSAKIE